MRRDRVREAIDKLFESEIRTKPRFKHMSPGQVEEFKGGFIDFAIMKMGQSFMESEDIGEQVQILKFLFDYSGHKPRVEHTVANVSNPYEGMSDEQLEYEERRLLSGEVEEACVVEAGKDNESQ